LTLTFYWLADWFAVGPGVPDNTLYVTVTNGTLTYNYPFTYVGTDDAGGWEFFSIPINEFAGSTDNLTIGWHINATIDSDTYFSIDNAQLIGLGPTIPTNQYYNNVDEKVIFSYDLTHAYEAILHFSQNYSFADENDIGQVEIWTGSAWQPIFVAKVHTS